VRRVNGDIGPIRLLIFDSNFELSEQVRKLNLKTELIPSTALSQQEARLSRIRF
jgi:hypothetical protein